MVGVDHSPEEALGVWSRDGRLGAWPPELLLWHHCATQQNRSEQAKHIVPLKSPPPPLQLCRDPGGKGMEWIRLVMGLT